MKKYRQQLNKLGMEKEYIQWKDNIVNPKTFESIKEGTKFRVIRGFNAGQTAVAFKEEKWLDNNPELFDEDHPPFRLRSTNSLLNNIWINRSLYDSHLEII